MLSSPRKPPPKTLLPSASLRFTHHVKFISSFWKIFSRNGKSVDPSIWNTRNAAQACTGGLPSSDDPSHGGRWPLGFRDHPPRNNRSCALGESDSTGASGPQCEATAHAADPGDS